MVYRLFIICCACLFEFDYFYHDFHDFKAYELFVDVFVFEELGFEEGDEGEEGISGSIKLFIED